VFSFFLSHVYFFLYILMLLLILLHTTCLIHSFHSRNTRRGILRTLTEFWTAGSAQMSENWSSRVFMCFNLVTVSCGTYWYSVMSQKDQFFVWLCMPLFGRFTKIWRPFMPLRPQSCFCFIIKLDEL
jgi:hypothetical protein